MGLNNRTMWEVAWKSAHIRRRQYSKWYPFRLSYDGIWRYFHDKCRERIIVNARAHPWNARTRICSLANFLRSRPKLNACSHHYHYELLRLSLRYCAQTLSWLQCTRKFLISLALESSWIKHCQKLLTNENRLPRLTDENATWNIIVWEWTAPKILLIIKDGSLFSLQFNNILQ